MAENVVTVRATRAEVRRIVADVARGDLGRTVLIRMGMALLGRIKKAFIDKARGGADESGLSWPKLSKSTVAYSRRHPGVPRANVRAHSSPSWALTKKQRERWWALYRSFLGKAPEGAAYHARGVNPGWAAARAWRQLKAEGARTLMMRYGDTPVEILRDTGLLLNSLSPGVPGSVENQVFRIGQGEVIIGTNRKFAVVQHEGRGHVPQRRLWPKPANWPESWWQEIAEQGRMAMIDILLAELHS